MIPKQRVQGSYVEPLIPNSIPKGTADRRQAIDSGNADFNGLTEIHVRENTKTAEGRDAVATQYCTGAPVEIEGFQLSQSGLLFMTAAHCDTDAPLGGFKVELDLSYTKSDGQIEVLHLETENPENMWFSKDYTAYSNDDDLENGYNDLALIFIPTIQPLPPEIKPFVYNPDDNNQLIDQYGASLMIPTVGIDSAQARVDMGVSVLKNNGPGDRVRTNGHVSQTTSGAPVIPHEHGEPIKDEQGRMHTIGPVASISPGGGLSFFSNADPKIFAEVPFLSRDGVYTPSNTLMAANQQPEAKIDSFSQTRLGLQADYNHASTGAPLTTDAIQTITHMVALTDDQPVEYIETVPINDMPPIEYLDVTPIYQPEAQIAFDYAAPTGISGIDAVRDSLQDDDVFFNIQHTGRGFVISDASEFDESSGTAFANATPNQDIGAFAPATLKA